MQQLTFIGNLGRDPEMRYTPSGQAVTNLSVAVNEQYTNSQGEKVETTTWFRVSAWGKLAEIVNQYLKQGRQVYIRGRLTADDNGNPKIWTTQDGEPRASFEVKADEVKFLGGNGQG